jgi:hypothetical protein
MENKQSNKEEKMKELFETLLKDVGKDFDGTIAIKYCDNVVSDFFVIIEVRHRRGDKTYTIIKSITKKEIPSITHLESFLKDILKHVIKDVKELRYIF